MSHRIRKLVRTMQSHAQCIKTSKERFYSYARGRLGMPHERDFRILSQLQHGADQCFVDIGANSGQSIESIRLFVPDARIVSFEPNIDLANKLRIRYGRQIALTVHAVALADCEGSFNLFIPVYNGVSYDELASLEYSAAAGWLTGDTIYRFRPERLIVIERQCEVRTLDSFMLNPAFIKIDAQGFEYNVLRGAIRTLEQHHPVLLVEAAAGDGRIGSLTRPLGYEEYFFDGDRLRPGYGVGDNSFLITPDRLRTLGQARTIA